MNNKKILTSTLVIGSSILLVLTLWQLPILLIIGLFITAFLKHRFCPIKKEFIMYVVSAIIGSLSESLIMITGPWSYASVQIFNFPVWLPFLWGLAGITVITIHEGIIRKNH